MAKKKTSGPRSMPLVRPLAKPANLPPAKRGVYRLFLKEDPATCSWAIEYRETTASHYIDLEPSEKQIEERKIRTEFETYYRRIVGSPDLPAEPFAVNPNGVYIHPRVRDAFKIYRNLLSI